MLLIEISKFVLRLIKHLFILLFVSLPLQLISIPILLLYLPFSTSNKLPYYLKWFDNADVWLNRDTSTYLSVITRGWFYRWYWLSIRNPTNYFGYVVLGIHVQTPSLVIQSFGNPSVGDSTASGLFYQEAVFEGDPKIYYEYYLIYKIGPSNCLRFRLGWKIGKPESNPIGSFIEQVLVFQLFIAYTGS